MFGADGIFKRASRQASEQTPRQALIAVVGGGWAGCAAAVELTLRGHRVHLFESAQILGGRSRRLQLPGSDDMADNWESKLDNGQHILLGAYAESLRLMRVVGVNVDDALLRLPLQMRYPPDTGNMDFLSARLPAPLHLIVGLIRTSGLATADKLALLRFASAARWMGWQLHRDCSVAQLLDTHDQTTRVIDLLWRPLCLAALNTPLEKASAQVFLTVLRNSLGAGRKASDMLLPRTDLSALFPHPAAAFVERHGGRVMRGARVVALERSLSDQQRWKLSFAEKLTNHFDAGQTHAYDTVILATPMAQTARLLSQLEPDEDTKNKSGETSVDLPLDLSPDLPETNGKSLHNTAYEPIITCYLQYAASLRLAYPFYALRDIPLQQRWGQFVFDKGHLNPAHTGLLAVVVSTATEAAALAQSTLGQSIAHQLATDFQMPALHKPFRVKVICEKRATFACTPDFVRLPVVTGIAGVLRAGDYVSAHNPIAANYKDKDDLSLDQARNHFQQHYPATIEAAVRSGVQAALYFCRN